MKACDICGKKADWLNKLHKDYATEDIEEVCDECLRTLNSHLDAVRRLQRKIFFTWMQRFMIGLKERFQHGSSEEAGYVRREETAGSGEAAGPQG